MAKQSAGLPIPTVVMIAVIMCGIGFFLGRMGHQQADAPVDDADLSSAPDEKQALPQSISPEDLAASKNVPATIESPQGDYTLVAVVEGTDANRLLNQNLQLVNAQRQRLNLLSRQYQQTSPSLAQQRELIAGQINETRAALESNLQFMAKNYAYTLSNNYMLVPHQATMSLVEGKVPEQKKTLVHTFEDAASYKAFQKLSDAYRKRKMEQLKAHQQKQREEANKPRQPLQPLPPEKTDKQMALPLTPEMKSIQSEMIKNYQCDPEKNYLVEFQKTALYARKVQ